MINVLVKVIVINVGAYSYVVFRVVIACLTFTLTCLILLLGILIATFIFHQLTYHLFTFPLYIFTLIPNQYQHIWLSFIPAHYTTVGKFYAFFTWPIDGLNVAFSNCGIFMLVIWFELHSFSNCIIVFRNLLVWFLMFLFTKIIVIFILPETPQRNSPFLISLIFCN